MKAQRSASYPSYTISFCLDYVHKLYESIGGNFHANREQVAKALGMSERSVQSQLSSCTQYGLLELKHGTGYKVSDLAVKWIRPISDQQKKEALIAAFSRPPLYTALITQFNGGVVPAEQVLASILLQGHRIYEAACDECAKIFIENAMFVGVLDGTRHMRMNGSDQPAVTPPLSQEQKQEAYEAALHGAIVHEPAAPLVTPPNPVQITATLPAPFEPSHKAEEERKENGSYETPAREPMFTITEGIPFNVPLKGKRTAQVVIPRDTTAKDCDTIINWIRLMKESFE